MADFGPTGLLQPMNANTELLGLEGIVPDGLRVCHLANQPSPGQHKPPDCTSPPPFRRNESLDSSRVEPGTYNCNMPQLTLPDMTEQATRPYYLTTFHRTLKVRLDHSPTPPSADIHL